MSTDSADSVLPLSVLMEVRVLEHSLKLLKDVHLPGAITPKDNIAAIFHSNSTIGLRLKNHGVSFYLLKCIFQQIWKISDFVC